MIGRCDGPYGKFHADLTLYSVAQQHYCQLYDQKPSRKDWTPQDGTLLEGSQHLYEVVADPVWSQGIFEYDWSDQNFLGTADLVFPFFDPSFLLFQRVINHAN